MKKCSSCSLEPKTAKCAKCEGDSFPFASTGREAEDGLREPESEKVRSSTLCVPWTSAGPWSCSSSRTTASSRSPGHSLPPGLLCTHLPLQGLCAEHPAHAIPAASGGTCLSTRPWDPGSGSWWPCTHHQHPFHLQLKIGEVSRRSCSGHSHGAAPGAEASPPRPPPTGTTAASALTPSPEGDLTPPQWAQTLALPTTPSAPDSLDSLAERGLPKPCPLPLGPSHSYHRQVGDPGEDPRTHSSP
ncbi:PREDICTED: protein capicua homolog [Cercocebus atys]|uniref:protein capicua homolog n=1 Tax=Cercocebus atys TaxID=9531 RepID=UPI0005F571B8|nr:PREDICTED: protein capicua homolog [Cercocebus atys]